MDWKDVRFEPNQLFGLGYRFAELEGSASKVAKRLFVTENDLDGLIRLFDEFCAPLEVVQLEQTHNWFVQEVGRVKDKYQESKDLNLPYFRFFSEEQLVIAAGQQMLFTNEARDALRRIIDGFSDTQWQRLLRSPELIPVAQELQRTHPVGISGDLLAAILNALPRCGPLESDESLRAAFIDERIRKWRNMLRTAYSAQSRAELLVDLLCERFDERGANALALALQVFGERAPGDTCKNELQRLATRLAEGEGVMLKTVRAWRSAKTTPGASLVQLAVDHQLVFELIDAVQRQSETSSDWLQWLPYPLPDWLFGTWWSKFTGELNRRMMDEMGDLDLYPVVRLPAIEGTSRSELSTVATAVYGEAEPIITREEYRQLPATSRHLLKEAADCYSCGQSIAAFQLAWKAVEVTWMHYCDRAGRQTSATSEALAQTEQLILDQLARVEETAFHPEWWDILRAFRECTYLDRLLTEASTRKVVGTTYPFNPDITLALFIIEHEGGGIAKLTILGEARGGELIQTEFQAGDFQYLLGLGTSSVPFCEVGGRIAFCVAKQCQVDQDPAYYQILLERIQKLRTQRRYHETLQTIRDCIEEQLNPSGRQAEIDRAHRSIVRLQGLMDKAQENWSARQTEIWRNLESRSSLQGDNPISA